MSSGQTDFEKASRQRQPSLLGEIVGFLNETKKWWLFPVVMVLLMLALLMLFGSGAAAPFIYTLF